MGLCLTDQAQLVANFIVIVKGDSTQKIKIEVGLDFPFEAGCLGRGRWGILGGQARVDNVEDT
jgi:hypothetical protein